MQLKKRNEELCIRKLKEQLNRLTWDYLQRFAENNGGNIVFSPLSIFTLLAIAADASAGRTKREIMDDLFGELSPEQALSALSALLQQIRDGDEFSDANAVIVNESISQSIQPSYPEHLRELFHGELFAEEDMVSAVNSWVEKQTNGMIRGIANDSMKEMLLCLVNACCFSAKWNAEYRDYQVENEDFHNSDGTLSRVRMLWSTEPTCFENDDYVGFAKPYKGGKLSFVALLPKNVDGFTEKAFNSLDFSKCLAGTENTMARVLLPEFQCSSEYDLTDTLKTKGVRTIFSPYADFSLISSSWLRVESMVHKANIVVDRQGTKAAAVTSMSFFAGAAPFEFPELKEVRLDRPFVYFIVHQETRVPVFAGVIRHLDPLGDDEDRLTTREKQALCKPVYDRICGMILDEDGILKDEFDRSVYWKTDEAYFKGDFETLKKIEDGLLLQ